MALTRPEIEKAVEDKILTPEEGQGFLSLIGEALGDFFTRATTAPQTISADIGGRDIPPTFAAEDEAARAAQAGATPIQQPADVFTQGLAPRPGTRDLPVASKGALPADPFTGETAIVAKTVPAGGAVFATPAAAAESVRTEEPTEVAAVAEAPPPVVVPVPTVGAPTPGGPFQPQTEARSKTDLLSLFQKLAPNADPAKLDETAQNVVDSIAAEGVAITEEDDVAQANIAKVVNAITTGLTALEPTEADKSAVAKQDKDLADLVGLRSTQQEELRLDRQNLINKLDEAEGLNQQLRTQLTGRREEGFERFERLNLEIGDELRDSKPVDFWENKTTGDRALAAISLFLGGLGAGLTGTPNFALQIIENEIARDVERQKETYDRLRERRADLKSAFAIRSQHEDSLFDDIDRNDQRLIDQYGRDVERLTLLPRITLEEIKLKRDDIATIEAREARATADGFRRLGFQVQAMEVAARGPEAEARKETMLAALETKGAQFERQAALIDDARQEKRLLTVFEAMVDERELQDRLESAEAIATQRAGVVVRGQDIGAEEAAGELALKIVDKLGGGREAGRELPASAVLKLAVVEQTGDIFKQVRQMHDELSDWWITRVFKLGVPFSSERVYNNIVDGLSRAYAASIEGGRISDVDAQAYRRMFPDAGDPKSVMEQKLDSLLRVSETRGEALRRELRKAGFFVAKSEQEKEDAYRIASSKIPSVDDLAEKFGFKPEGVDVPKFGEEGSVLDLVEQGMRGG